MPVPVIIAGVAGGVVVSGALVGATVAVKKRRRRRKKLIEERGGEEGAGDDPNRGEAVEFARRSTTTRRGGGSFLSTSVRRERSRGTQQETQTPIELSCCEADADSDASGQSFHSCASLKTCLDMAGEMYTLPEAIDGGEYLAFPTCSKQTALYDFGFSAVFKSCQSCGARPIRNRGCAECNKVMCMTCFEAHKELRITTVELAQAAILKYDTAEGGKGSLLCAEYNRLLYDLEIPTVTQQEFDACCLARGSDPRREGINFEHLIVLITFLTPNASEALARAARRTIELEACRGDERMHDWGPGVAVCAMCGSKPILNRGCRSCNRRICGRCFPTHQRLQREAYDKKKIENGELVKSFCTVATQHGPRYVGPSFRDGMRYTTPLVSRGTPATFDSPTGRSGGSAASPQSATSAKDRQFSPRDSVPDEVGTAGDNTTELSAGSPVTSAPPSTTPTRTRSMGGTTVYNGSVGQSQPMNKSLSAYGKDGDTETPAADNGAATPQTQTKRAVVPPDMGNNIPAGSEPKVLQNFEFFDEQDSVDHLKAGGSLYYFTFLKGTQIATSALHYSNILINLSSFKNELEENAVPHVDPFSPEDQSEHIFMLNKAVYMLGDDVKLSSITKELIASQEYQSNCQPGNVKLYDTPGLVDTFRFKKTVIWPVYSITIQFKVSVLDPVEHPRLLELNDNLPIHLALLLERTKRNKGGLDVIKKTKSILMYHEFPNGGILVTNVTTGAATSVPSVIASMVDKLGSIGAKDVSDTAIKTRKYFKNGKK